MRLLLRRYDASMTDQSPADDAALLTQVAQKNQVALSALYDRYSRVIYSIAYKSLNSAEEAEEVVLDVFAQVWRIAERYDSAKGRVDTWLFMLARSRVLDRLRSLQRSSKVATASMESARSEPMDYSNDPITDVLILERRSQVLAALATLPTEQRLAIELAYYQGFTHSEIAAQTSVSLGTVKTRIRLGLTKLRVAMGDWR
jgi:RNA polymerase sigma-70 factor (ECF subfamily)